LELGVAHYKTADGILADTKAAVPKGGIQNPAAAYS